MFSAPTICVTNGSLNAGSGCSRALRADGLMIFSGGGSLLSSLSIDASSAPCAAQMPNDKVQQTCANRMPVFTCGDSKESSYQNQAKDDTSGCHFDPRALCSPFPLLQGERIKVRGQR